MQMLPALFILQLVSFFSLSIAQPPQSNVIEVSINDTDRIVRSGSGWVDNEWVPPSIPSKVCGSWTREVGDSVTFTFTGTSVSVEGDIVYPKLTQATLDGNLLTPLPGRNVICGETLFSAQDLDPVEHTLVVTAIGNGAVLAIQVIRYTTPNVTMSDSSSDLPAASTSDSQSATLTDLAFLGSDTLTATSDPQATNVQATDSQITDAPATNSPATNAPATNSQSIDSPLNSIQSGSKSSPSRTSTVSASSVSSAIGSSAAPRPEVRIGAPQRTGAIAGGVTGSIAGLLLLVLAFLHAHEILYYLSSLGFASFGWLLFKGRIFVLIPDRKIGAIDITLFLSNHEYITDTPTEGSEVMLVWQVASIGYSRRSFSVCCPCVNGTGNTMLGFGVVNHETNVIRSEMAAPAPARWNGDEFVDTTPEGSEVSSASPDFKNDHPETSVAITLGTHENNGTFRPFLWIKDVPAGKTYTADNNFYVHAFITHGYKDGQYGERLVGEIRRDMLTDRGIKVTDLKPTSNWYISQTAMGRKKLKVKGYINEKVKADDEEKLLQRSSN